MSANEIIELPVNKWMAYAVNKSSVSEQFTAGRAVFSELETSGFNVSPDLSSVQPQINTLMNTCECVLSPESVVELPLSDWIDIWDQAQNKNRLTRFFTKWKINKKMHRSGLKKLKNLNMLNDYIQLRNMIIKTQHEVLIEYLKAS